MGTYAVSGDSEVEVTVGGASHRAYSISVAGSGNTISARAFEDDPEDTAVVTVNKARDITLRFRFDPGVAVDDTVTISSTIAEDTVSYSAKVTTTDLGVTVDGVADFGFTCRVLPSGS